MGGLWHCYSHIMPHYCHGFSIKQSSYGTPSVRSVPSLLVLQHCQRPRHARQLSVSESVHDPRGLGHQRASTVMESGADMADITGWWFQYMVSIWIIYG